MPFSSLFFNHGRPTCHFVENFPVLDSDFPYSFDWSQVAFGAFSFFLEFFDYFGDSRNIQCISTFFYILYAISLRKNTQWSESWKSTENNLLAMSSSTWQTKDYFSNKKFYLKTSNPKETQWKHFIFEVDFLWYTFVKSLQFANKRICSSQERPIYLITDGSMVNSSISLYK